jgi:3-oxoacyl-[acyl-carrier-protein] synthase II
MVTGGSEAACNNWYGGFNAMHALSTRNDDQNNCGPMDRDGFVLGEGAGSINS